MRRSPRVHDFQQAAGITNEQFQPNPRNPPPPAPIRTVREDEIIVLTPRNQIKPNRPVKIGIPKEEKKGASSSQKRATSKRSGTSSSTRNSTASSSRTRNSTASSSRNMNTNPNARPSHRNRR